MPRRPDPSLDKRVLDAAWRLWKGGDKRLSLRSLARAAGTNTPAIYRHFRSRKEILRALLLRLRHDLYQRMAASATMVDAFDAYLDFALHHPREYQMFFENQYELLARWRPGRSARDREKMPGFFWGLEKLAGELGGSPESHIPLAVTLWAQVHGTASLLISRAVEEELEGELRAESRRAVQVLMDAASKR